jgi:hypothetical protein
VAVRLPTLSPICPKTHAPNGLARYNKPIDKIESPNAILDGNPEKNTVGHAVAAAILAINKSKYSKYEPKLATEATR